MPMYLLARLPAVILLIAEEDGVSREGSGGLLDDLDAARGRALGVWNV